MNLSEFRADLSNQFNKALTGPVYVERGGVTYSLQANIANPSTVSTPTIKPTTPPVSFTANKPGMFDRPPSQFCKHGNVTGLCKQGCR